MQERHISASTSVQWESSNRKSTKYWKHVQKILGIDRSDLPTGIQWVAPVQMKFVAMVCYPLIHYFTHASSCIFIERSNPKERIWNSRISRNCRELFNLKNLHVKKPVFLKTCIQCFLHINLDLARRHLTLTKVQVPDVLLWGQEMHTKVARNTAIFLFRV